jgi:hypothetical protein
MTERDRGSRLSNDKGSTAPKKKMRVLPAGRTRIPAGGRPPASPLEVRYCTRRMPHAPAPMPAAAVSRNR